MSGLGSGTEGVIGNVGRVGEVGISEGKLWKRL